MCNLGFDLHAGYRISWEEFNRTNTRVTHYLPNLTQEYKVTGLTALTTYTIQVAAMTSKGQGQLSSSTISSGVPPGQWTGLLLFIIYYIILYIFMYFRNFALYTYIYKFWDVDSYIWGEKVHTGLFKVDNKWLNNHFHAIKYLFLYDLLFTKQNLHVPLLRNQ